MDEGAKHVTFIFGQLHAVMQFRTGLFWTRFLVGALRCGEKRETWELVAEQYNFLHKKQP